MADDMRAAVGGLAWVRGVSVVLGEHMYADKINRGISQGLSFQETFGSEATGDLSEVRRTFLLKAFQRRQEALLNQLMAQGYTSVGAGSSVVPVRLNCPPEITLHCLRRG